MSEFIFTWSVNDVVHRRNTSCVGRGQILTRAQVATFVKPRFCKVCKAENYFKETRGT